MSAFIEPIGRLINQFTKLPGVGAKTAQRYAYKIINMTDDEAKEFAESIIKAKREVHYCSVCGNFTEKETCYKQAYYSHDRIGRYLFTKQVNKRVQKIILLDI